MSTFGRKSLVFVKPFLLPYISILHSPSLQTPIMSSHWTSIFLLPKISKYYQALFYDAQWLHSTRTTTSQKLIYQSSQQPRRHHRRTNNQAAQRPFDSQIRSYTWPGTRSLCISTSSGSDTSCRCHCCVTRMRR